MIPKIKRTNLPKDFPVQNTLITILMLKVFEFSDWLTIGMIALLAIEWIISIIIILRSKEINIFKKQ